MKVKLLSTTGFGRSYIGRLARDDTKSINVLLRLYNKLPSPELARAIWEVAKLLGLSTPLAETGLPESPQTHDDAPGA